MLLLSPGCEVNIYLGITAIIGITKATLDGIGEKRANYKEAVSGRSCLYLHLFTRRLSNSSSSTSSCHCQTKAKCFRRDIPFSRNMYGPNCFFVVAVECTGPRIVWHCPSWRPQWGVRAAEAVLQLSFFFDIAAIQSKVISLESVMRECCKITEVSNNAGELTQTSSHFMSAEIWT